MSKILYFDCFSGASGDMILGALIDAGLPLDELRAALGSLALNGVTLKAERVDRSGIAATNFSVVTGEHSHEVHAHTHDHDHDHDHPSSDGERQSIDDGGDHHHDHHHRGLTEICAMVDESALSSSAQARAKHLFSRLGQDGGGDSISNRSKTSIYTR